MNVTIPCEQLRTFIPLIEKFLLSENRQAFIQSLPKDQSDSYLMQLCTQKLTWAEKQTLINRLGLPKHVKETLTRINSLVIIENEDSSADDRNKAVELIKRLRNMQFDHPKPTATTSYAEEAVNPASYPTELKDQDYSLNKYLENNSYEGSYSNLSSYGISTLPIDRCLGLAQADLDSVVRQINLATLGDQAVKILEKWLELKRQKNKNIQLEANDLSRLTSQQLESLAKSVPDVLNSKDYYLLLYKKTLGQQMRTLFPETNNTLLSKEALQTKKEFLKKTIIWLKNFKFAPLESFSDQLVVQILSINILLDNPELDLFLEYLKRPRNVIGVFADNYRNQLNKGRQHYNFDNFWFRAHQLNTSIWPSDQKLVEEYLKLYFNHNSDTKNVAQFEKFFKLQFLNKIIYRVRLEKGETTPDLPTIFSKDQESDIKSKKELTICDRNKKKFTTKQDISLTLLAKNVSQITADIYEISTEKHFLKSKTKIDDSIDLEFLEPLKKVTLKVDNSNPFKVNKLDFSLSQHLESRNSIYIVDFHGQGILSRAVIRRGSIICVNKQTLSGVQVAFMYEDGLPIEELDIWIRGRKVHVKGKYTIPFGQTHEALDIVAVKDGYAQLINVTINKEQYSWYVNYTYHEENFLVGSQATILIYAQPMSPSGPLSSQILKDSNIVVNTVNHLGIPSSLSFRGIKWDSKNEYQLKIPVQTYLREVNINVTATVDKYVGEPQKLISSKSIKFRQLQEGSDLTFMEYFLSSTSTGYILKLLGKNGQPKPHVSTIIEVSSRLYNSTLRVECMTDKNGQIKLGWLKDLTLIVATSTATSTIQSVAGIWQFNNIENQVGFKGSLVVGDNEEFQFPTYRGFDLARDVSLVQVSNRDSNQVISDCSKKLKLDEGRIKCSLDKGAYSLSFPALNKTIRIQVRKLSKWGNTSYQIDTEAGLVYSTPPSVKNVVSLPDSFSNTKQKDSSKISLKLQANHKAGLENARVHILASRFVYKTGYSLDIASMMPNSREAQFIQLKSNTCSFLNNKELSDEHCYILNRQKEEKFIGNNLERPRVLLKRTFNKDTDVKKQQLESAKQFRSTLRGEQNMCMDSLDGMQMRSVIQQCGKKQGGGARMMQKPYREGISLFNNFLKHPSLIIPNIHGDTIEFDLPDWYQSFVVIVASPTFAIQKLYSLDNVSLETNDLTSTGLKHSSDKDAFTISRECYKLQQGETLKVKKSSQWASVGSDNLTTLADINGSNLFQWVMNWPSYSPDKKLEVYDQFVCHQLNVFLKYKDRQFFNEVVRPHVANKLEKRVVDYCLLEDKEVVKYSRPEQLLKLNPFEKCLVAEYLAKNNQLDKAKAISEAMALQYKSFKLPYSQFQNKFDTIMTSKQASTSAQEAQDDRVVQCAYSACPPPMAMAMAMPRYTDTRCDQMARGFAGGAPKIQMSRKGAPANFGGEFTQQSLQCFQDQDIQEKLEERKKFKPGFKEVEKTKQYVQTTYYQMKDPNTSTHHITLSKFWVDLAAYFVAPNKAFVSESFMYLSSRCQISLAVAFSPFPLSPKYTLKADGEFVLISAESTFMVFVKEIKSMEFLDKYGVLISQRISDPFDEFDQEEDGTVMQKPVLEFVKDQPYYLQTVITNTASANLELQVLIDIPEGSIPLGSNEYTRVNSQFIGSYQTQSFKRAFYFPKSGSFSIYPANASKNRQVISRAASLGKVEVKEQKTIKKLQTLNDVLVSGSKSDILNFLKTKNIFDSATFNVSSILWLLKEKEMYKEILAIFRDRYLMPEEVWKFGFYHNDPQTIREYFRAGCLTNTLLEVNVFEYYPLTSQRAHKFMKAEKSTILNETFKQTYENFLLTSLLTQKTVSPLFLTVFSYYLVLQDRVKEANEVFKMLSKAKEQHNFPKLQYDYLACFLDVYTGYPNFVVARQVSAKYVSYPVITWRKMFKQIDSLLNTHDTTLYVQQQTQSHDIKIVPRGSQLSVTLPEKTSVELNLHAVNLELMFSNSPFDEIKLLSTVRPFKTIVVTSEKGGQQLVDNPGQYSDIYVNPVELSSDKQGQELQSFLWANDSVKVKVLQEEGVAVVYVDGKPKPGVYCKIYAKGKETRFYKDGYTDIQGKFKYVSQLDDVDKFSMLFVTDKGGVIKTARKPTTTGTL